MREPPIRVAISESNALLRELLTGALMAAGGLAPAVVASTRDAHALVRDLHAAPRDLLLLDLEPVRGQPLASEQAAELIRALRAAAPAIRILAMSDTRHACFVTALMRAWANGHVVKCAISVGELMSAIDAVSRGSLFLCAESKRLIGQRAGGPQLTQRELEVLRLLAAGVARAEISRRLFVAQGTLGRHVANMVAKLEVGDVREVIERAQALGWVE